ncbi:Gamma-glutamyltranspeptidase 1 [Smittium culicis]|uniref:Glutathione hydrolase n=1 Tax=Smittium culicis TaxID=133412 RepID=A0A1R1XPT3_9FUNG|nr:Gamma-glutamyltranspeptidase 1 [Smittium culicis]
MKLSNNSSIESGGFFKRKIAIISIMAISALSVCATPATINERNVIDSSISQQPSVSEMYKRYMDAGVMKGKSGRSKASKIEKRSKKPKCKSKSRGEGITYDSSEAFGKTGAVAADEGRCSEIGVNVLKDGGSAVDAAISSAICIGLLNPHSSGIGGGGFMVIRKPNGESEMIDFREMAPAAATPDMYVKNNTLSAYGGLASGVPGELRGYELAHKRHGRLSFSRLLEPTIKLARGGYAIGRDLASALLEKENDLRNDEGARQVYFKPDGSILKLGDIGKRVNFANTLQKIADQGVDSFYTGDLAKAMVKTIQENGGILTLEDFAKYKPELRSTGVISYNGRKIITATPPASGSVITTIFNILEGYDLKNPKDRELSVHRIIEAFKFGFSLRTDLGDPAFVNVTEIITKSYDKNFAAKLRSRITDEETHSYAYYDLKNDFKSDHGTTHVSALDKDGMAVSLTSTINLYFGSKLIDPVTGVIFNNEMDDFGTPGLINAFGLSPSPSNFIAPGKRPLSSTSATIVEKDGKVEFVLGASGGSRIITATSQVFLNMVEFGKSLKDAVDMPRIHDQMLPEVTEFELSYPKYILDSLASRKHNLTEMEINATAVQGIRVLSDGTINAVSDARKSGAPSAY